MNCVKLFPLLSTLPQCKLASIDWNLTHRSCSLFYIIKFRSRWCRWVARLTNFDKWLITFFLPFCQTFSSSTGNRYVMWKAPRNLCQSSPFHQLVILLGTVLLNLVASSLCHRPSRSDADRSHPSLCSAREATGDSRTQALATDRHGRCSDQWARQTRYQIFRIRTSSWTNADQSCSCDNHRLHWWWWLYWVRQCPWCDWVIVHVYFNVRYLNDWDKRIPNLDVADDYRSERQEILKAQGKNFPFSFGDVRRPMTPLRLSDNFPLRFSTSSKFWWAQSMIGSTLSMNVVWQPAHPHRRDEAHEERRSVDVRFNEENHQRIILFHFVHADAELYCLWINDKRCVLLFFLLFWIMASIYM